VDYPGTSRSVMVLTCRFRKSVLRKTMMAPVCRGFLYKV
jgi:hypothetical protein